MCIRALWALVFVVGTPYIGTMKNMMTVLMLVAALGTGHVSRPVAVEITTDDVTLSTEV